MPDAISSSFAPTAYAPLNFTDGNGGLTETQNGTHLIQLFNNLVQGQPNFIISRESWQRLSKPTSMKGHFGLHVVYAFAFCFAIERDTSGDLHYYFRVRKLLLPNFFDYLFSIFSFKPRDSYYVDTQNIAYTDLEIAIANQKNGTNVDCLTFMNVGGTRKQAKEVNDEVTNFAKEINDPSSNFKINNIVPKSDGPAPKIAGNIDLTTQQGVIFTKKRIWDELLNDKYSAKKRFQGGKPPVDNVNVNFALDERTGQIQFVFRINDDYETTGIKCPYPAVCGA